ncbi:MAG TPA: hypothetical protein VFD41_12770 [Actinomycetales bacterium]|nr:hypothetical protein [Actinomycetales bacterium]
MVDVPAWLVVIGAAVGYAIALGQNRIAKKSNEDTVDTAKRAETMATYRWAAELMASDSENERQVGITALNELAERADVTAADKRLINAVLDVPLAPVTTAWDDVGERGVTVEVIDPEFPGQEEQ